MIAVDFGRAEPVVIRVVEHHADPAWDDFTGVYTAEPPASRWDGTIRTVTSDPGRDCAPYSADREHDGVWRERVSIDPDIARANGYVTADQVERLRLQVERQRERLSRVMDERDALRAQHSALNEVLDDLDDQLRATTADRDMLRDERDIARDESRRAFNRLRAASRMARDLAGALS